MLSNRITLASSYFRGGSSPGANITLDPDNLGANLTLSNGDLTITSTVGVYDTARGQAFKPSGKFYYEFTTASPGSYNYLIGFGNSSHTLDGKGPGQDAFNSQGWAMNGAMYINNSFISYGGAYAPTDICGLAVDLNDNLLYCRVNGTWYNASDPTAGTGGTPLQATGDLTPMGAPLFATTSITFNFGDGGFANTIPSGYEPWTI